MEDEELERIKKKQMEELLQQQNQNKIVNEKTQGSANKKLSVFGGPYLFL